MSDDRIHLVLRRGALWLVVCAVSAAPSFILAAGEFSRPAMGLGVVMFAAAYTAVTCTEHFERFHTLPFVRRTLYIGYGLRLVLSVAFPVGMAADLIPGMVSLGLVQRLGLEPHSFAGSLATTVVQGGFLNVILFVFMTALYLIQQATMKPPAVEPRNRGFEVVLPALPGGPAAGEGSQPNGEYPPART